MAQLVCSTAQIKCSFGVAPSALIVIPSSMVMVNNMPAATIMDFNPMANIPPFGMCMTITNPAVAAATSAALGVFTPAPCIPVTAPWVPGSPTVLIGNKPALSSTSTCMCTWGGVITVLMPGQMQTQVP
jgi:hypothetical protein